MDEERRIHPVGREEGLVPVVQVVARDAAKIGDRRGVALQPGGAVDEDVASVTPQEEGPDAELGREGQRLGRRGVEAGDLYVGRGDPNDSKGSTEL
jgi:hypothetical protein